jgi:uncharacterized membrane protein YkvA (DUF1232 family)
MSFIKNLYLDPRIPSWDKKVIIALVVLIISPLDFIPDWFPIIGQLDDLIMIGLISDYIFHFLDDEIALSHWPHQLKYFILLKKFFTPFAFMAPKVIRNRIFKFKPRPY